MNRIVADSVILSNIESKSNVVVLETGHGLMVLVLSGTWEILVLTWTQQVWNLTYSRDQLSKKKSPLIIIISLFSLN